MKKIKPAAHGHGLTGFGNNHNSKFTISPESCTRFEKCCANICSLDPDWRLRTHMRDERVCFYLREYVKSGNRPNFIGGLTREILDAIEKAYPEIIFRWHDIKKQLQRSAKTGSKIGKQPGKQMEAVA